MAVHAGAVPFTQNDGVKVKYILPEGFHGWACADYGVKAAAPLARDANGVFVIEPVNGGIVTTSSLPHLTQPPFPSEVMQRENGRLRPVEIHGTANHGEYGSDDTVSRYCVFFGSDQDAAAAPRPPTLRESKWGTSPLLQRIEFEEGSLCDFRDVSRVCLEASDVSKNKIAATIAARVPQVPIRAADSCGAFSGIVVQYHADWSSEIDGSVPRHRNAIAQLGRHVPRTGTIAMATWVDAGGGGAEEVATRFAADLADFFRQAATLPCTK